MLALSFAYYFVKNTFRERSGLLLSGAIYE